jgi:hypothetical protein
MKKLCCFIVLLVRAGLVVGQDTLTYDDFLEWVRSYHPVARQADVTLEMGRQELRMARGGFDPLLYGTLDEKNYNGSEYYK